MPRLSNTEYLHMRQFLRDHWRSNQALFSTLSPNDQWLLHAYFRPSEALTNQALLQHRADITEKRPGLPQQAGRAYAKFCAQAAALARTRAKQPVPASTRHRGAYNLSVQSVVRPEPDVQKLVKALIQMAEIEQRRQPPAA
jgi:hypothetical protein